MSYVFIGLSMMAFISASMLAIDVGMLMTARSQAQNSADAGALAGATALLWSAFPAATAAHIKLAVTQTSTLRRASIVPPLLDAAAAYQVLLAGSARP
jgi:hypothetical protein